MEKHHFTIIKPDSAYYLLTSEDGDMPTIYHHESDAKEQIEHAEDPHLLRVSVVSDLYSWLHAVRSAGFQRVYELEAHTPNGGPIGGVRDVSMWLASLQVFGKD